MKVIGNLPIVKKEDENLPFGGGIQNETDTQEGTPVVDDVLQDLLINAYKLLQLTGITPTNGFDSDATQYQLIEALKKLPNSTNDIEQVLSLDGTVWNLGLNLDILPDRYVCFGRASDNYQNGVSYSIVGTGEAEYGFTSNGFNSGDELIIVIDSSNVRAYSLTMLADAAPTVFTLLGNPLSYNDTYKVWYQEGGKLISDDPFSVDLQEVVQGEYEDSTLTVLDIFITQGVIFCFCFIPSGNQYFFRQFDWNDLSSSIGVDLIGTSFGTSGDYSPYVFVNENNVFITNDNNNSHDDYHNFSKFTYSPNDTQLTLISQNELDTSFIKTSNSVIKNGKLYTLVSGNLERYDLNTGVKEVVGEYLGVSGQIFSLNGEMYHTTGEVAKKWL